MRADDRLDAKPDRAFRLTVAIGWVVLAIAAAVYSRLKAVPTAIAVPLVLAFLVEYPFYLLPGFATARAEFFARGKARGATVLALSAIVPWLIYALPTGHFSFPALILLSCIAVVMSFWYVLYPAHPLADVLYLCLFAAVILFKVFARVYPVPLPAPMPKLDVSILGHVMLIRVFALSMVSLRGGEPGADYRFWPTAREWLAGLRWFIYLMPVTGAAYWALGLVALRPHPLNVLAGIGTFFGILWVTCISEEYIFRGLLQSWISKWTSSWIAGLIITSLLFGAIHLGFHGTFPNWRFSIAAAILGLFCGLARRQTGGIQAGMVAHALTVAVWKMFLL